MYSKSKPSDVKYSEFDTRTSVITQIPYLHPLVHNSPHPCAVFSIHCDYTGVSCSTMEDRSSRILCGLMCLNSPSRRERESHSGSRIDSWDRPCYNSYRAVGSFL